MIPTLRIHNGKLQLDLTALQAEATQFSFLQEQATAGDAQIFLQSYVGFVANQLLLIEGIGAETAEIVQISGTPTVNGGAVLAAVLVRSHPVNAKVYAIDFDQIELSHATTATGSKTTLTTTLGSGIVAVQPDRIIQLYNDSQFTTGYYFARYKNSVSGTFSEYTDALLYTNWDQNTVGYMIERALRELGEELSDKVQRYDCYGWLNEGLKFVQGKLKRWPEHYSYNAVLGQIQRGVNVTAMPTDAYDTETNKSLIALRVGAGKKLVYLSPSDFDDAMGEAISTQVTTQATAGQTTLAIDNSYDFPDSGSVNVYISGTKYNITYTGVTRSATAGVLTGIPASGTGAITVTIPADTYVWHNEQEGIPSVFTVRNGNIEIWPLADSANSNTNLFGDYSKVATSVDGDGDTIDSQRFDMFLNYLTFRIKMKARNNGTLDLNDGFYLAFKEKLNDAIRTLPQNNKFRIRPNINRIGGLRSGRMSRANPQDLSIDDQ